MNTESDSPPEPETIFYIGHHDVEQTEAGSSDLLPQARELGYDFITTPITTPAFHAKVLELLRDYQSKTTRHDRPDGIPRPSVPPLIPADSVLEPQNANGSLFGVVSPWIDLGSPDPIIAYISRQILNVEVAYAAFCGISNIVVYGPSSSTQLVQFARDIREALGLGPYIQLHILLPMTGGLEVDYGDMTHLSELVNSLLIDEEEQEAGQHNLYHSWDHWNTIRTVCNYSQKLSIALELPRLLPSSNLQSRWYSEPVRILSFPRTTFLRNAKGYPVLSKQHQNLLSRFARLRFPPWMLLTDLGSIQMSSSSIGSLSSSEPTPAEASSRAKEKPKDPAPHLRYLRHLQQNQPPVPPIERFGQGYQDYLQSPLQPLTDNLESVTYEVFERDPIKYEWYEKAIAAALFDITVVLTEAREITVAVVGAGRGPLVTRALNASEKTGIVVRCWAVEKNPNAFVLLQRKKATDPQWRGRVQVVKSDMRHWSGPSGLDSSEGKVDILISELLGSFGDNELSPECLDGVQHVLNPEHGVSIPQSYSAHLTPISTPRLYNDLLSRPGSEKWELPYVVMLHQYDYLSMQNDSSGTILPDVKEAWSFSHPLPAAILEHSRSRAGGHRDAGGLTGGDGTNEHNARACTVSFTCRESGLCHGLAGYFETVLYANSSETIELSTNPVTMEEKSKDMISWFPIFFPLKTPVYVPASSDLHVSMWRQTDDRNVWYEWMVEVFENVNGKTRRISVSELHSSRKHACLI